MIQYDKAAGQFVCDFVERLPTTDTGKPFRLYPEPSLDSVTRTVLVAATERSV